MKKQNPVFIIFINLLFSSVYAQNNISIGILGDKFSDFALTSLQGDQISTQNYRGKNILLIVPRGKYQDDKWCTLCNYQYAEFADLENNEQIRNKYNLEILFLFPYPKDTMVKWLKDFPGELNKIEKWKNPGDLETLTQGQKKWMEFTRKHYPKYFDYINNEVYIPFPILIDDNLEVSKGLDLSRTEWSGTKTLQNIPAIFLIDKDGILCFKYVSQSTVDRPSAKYIQTILETMQ